jgi:hypothetical protein
MKFLFGNFIVAPASNASRRASETNCYGRRSTILTSQVPVDKWHNLIGDPTYADAILDRLVSLRCRPPFARLRDDGGFDFEANGDEKCPQVQLWTQV